MMTTYGNDRRGGNVALVIGIFIVWLAGVMLVPFEGWASHDRPVFIVDANNPPEDDLDGDYHFRSLTAALTQFPNPKEDESIKLAPGTYIESIILDVEGLTLEATGELDQTILQGQITIDAKRITVTGITIDATGLLFGLEVLEDKAIIESLNVFGADTGILLQAGAPVRDLVLTNNRIYQNRMGINAQDVRYASITNNVIEANTQAGGRFEALYQVQFSNNIWRSNERGLILRASREIELLNETLSSNNHYGARLNAVDRVLVKNALVESNRAVGLRLDDGKDNQILNSQFRHNHQAGLRLENHSQQNVLQNNVFEAHTQAGSSGLWVLGPVYDNTILNNEFIDNWVGIRLSESDGAPASNRFEGNNILNANTDGLRVEASDGDNLFIKNSLIRNNQNGVYLAGGDDEFSENNIEFSGAEGIWVDGSVGLIVSRNSSTSNQSNGLRMSGTAINNRIFENHFAENYQHGVFVEDGVDHRIERNSISQNHRNGVYIGNIINLELNENFVDNNGEIGLRIHQAEKLDADGNTISHNQRGGVLVESGIKLDLEGNAIFNNLHMGLRLEGGDLIAKRNWWGDVLGPAGLFEGRGNAVIGTHLEQIVPWLPDEPDKIDLTSAYAEILDAIGRRETLEIDLRDRAGLRLDLSELGVDEDGKRVPISLGAILLSRYQQTELEDIPELPETLALYHVQLNGLENGIANLIVELGDIETSLDFNRLALWYWDGEKWLGLPGRLREVSQQVTGEIRANLLKPGLIALAPRSSEARVFMEPVTTASAALTGAGRTANHKTVSLNSSIRLEDFSLLFIALGALGLGRLLRKYPLLISLDRIQFR